MQTKPNTILDTELEAGRCYGDQEPAELGWGLALLGDAEEVGVDDGSTCLLSRLPVQCCAAGLSASVPTEHRP